MYEHTIATQILPFCRFSVRQPYEGETGAVVEVRVPADLHPESHAVRSLIEHLVLMHSCHTDFTPEAAILRMEGTQSDPALALASFVRHLAAHYHCNVAALAPLCDPAYGSSLAEGAVDAYLRQGLRIEDTPDDDRLHVTLQPGAGQDAFAIG